MPAGPFSLQQAAPAAKPDSLATLLGLLASVYGIHPGGCWVRQLLQQPEPAYSVTAEARKIST